MAPFRKPHGVVQISSCWAQAVVGGRDELLGLGRALRQGGRPPVTGMAYVAHVARDAGCEKSIART